MVIGYGPKIDNYRKIRLNNNKNWYSGIFRDVHYEASVKFLKFKMLFKKMSISRRTFSKQMNSIAIELHKLAPCT